MFFISQKYEEFNFKTLKPTRGHGCPPRADRARGLGEPNFSRWEKFGDFKINFRVFFISVQ